MKKKWECWECQEHFKTKKELIEHLKDELNEGESKVDLVVEQFEDMGIENPYK